MALMPVSEALARLLKGVTPVEGTEDVALLDADDRILAHDLAAGRNQPPFAASAMDGYAVRAADAFQGAVLAVIGEAAAGHAFDGAVGDGQAVRIFTGAPVPAGADSILIQENAEPAGDSAIRVTVSAEPDRFIRPEGLDFKDGESLLRAGTLLDAGRLTLAAAMNIPLVGVRRRPVVAILATGDELVAPGEIAGPHQIIASNSVGVAAIARRGGAATLDLGIVPDRQPAIEEAIDRARAAGADILVTLGGASVGDHDLVQAALKARGMALDFWKIAMRPGKPLMSGRLGPMHVLGLPGNPVSSLVCSHIFLRPLVARLAGRSDETAVVAGLLGTALGANDQRQDYLRARLERTAAGDLVAHPFSRQDSSMMRLFSEADGLVIRAPHAPPAEAGEPCLILLIRPNP